MIKLGDFLPPPEDLLALEPEQIAGGLMGYLNAVTDAHEEQGRPQPKLFHRGNFSKDDRVREYTRRAGWFDPLRIPPIVIARIAHRDHLDRLMVIAWIAIVIA